MNPPDKRARVGPTAEEAARIYALRADLAELDATIGRLRRTLVRDAWVRTDDAMYNDQEGTAFYSRDNANMDSDREYTLAAIRERRARIQRELDEVAQ